jgi:hypothetical protein
MPNYTFVCGWHIAIAEQLDFSLLSCSSKHHLCIELLTNESTLCDWTIVLSSSNAGFYKQTMVMLFSYFALGIKCGHESWWYDFAANTFRILQFVTKVYVYENRWIADFLNACNARKKRLVHESKEACRWQWCIGLYNKFLMKISQNIANLVPASQSAHFW